MKVADWARRGTTRCNVQVLLLLLTALWVASCAHSGWEPGVNPLAFAGKRLHAGPPLPAPGVLSPSLWGQGSPATPHGIVTDPGELPRMRVGGDPNLELPLEHTHVSARVVDFVAEVEVAQTYRNPHQVPIEVVYVFPLPENSAVHHLRMEIGRRVIVADIRERERARREYEVARAAGHTAALLEQERPNVFTQSVANIAPGETIDVVVRYMQDLTYDNGQYEFVFPMVVGPRYFGGAPLEGERSGTGTKRDTTQVPDAARISPPYLGKGQRSGHDISLELVVDSNLAITGYESPTHEIVTTQPADGTLRLSLAPHETLPNRDFVLRYRVAGMQPTARLYVSPEGEQGSFFSLVVVPPVLDVEQLVGRREFVFVVDRSGSMTGVPLALARRVITESLAQLRPVDTFNVLSFSGATHQAFERSRPANRANVLEAMELVSELGAEGVTEMESAVDLALAPRVAPERDRYVFFVTDGQIGDERAVVARAERFVRTHHAFGRRARVFGLGVGAAPNRHLIDTLSQAGGGIALYASVLDDAPYVVNRFFHYVDRAVMTDLRVEWGSLVPSEVEPRELPDLFASHPLIVHGRFTGSPIAAGRVVGRVGQREVELPIVLHPAPRGENRNAVLAALWARAKIGALEQRLAEGSTDAQAAITKLGLDFHLVTPFTSLVAVDHSRQVGDGQPKRVVQPMERPKDVDLDAAGGDELDKKKADDGYGYTFEDDPLNAGGWGTNDATIRTRPQTRSAPMGRVDGVPAPAAAAEELDAPPPPPPPAPQKSKPKRGGRAFRAAAPEAAPVAAPEPLQPEPLSEQQPKEPDLGKPRDRPDEAAATGEGQFAGEGALGSTALPTEEAAADEKEDVGAPCEIDPDACPPSEPEEMKDTDETVYAVSGGYSPRGCYCRAIHSAPSGAGWWSLLLVATLGARRRGRVKGRTRGERWEGRR